MDFLASKLTNDSEQHEGLRMLWTGAPEAEAPVPTEPQGSEGPALGARSGANSPAACTASEDIRTHNQVVGHLNTKACPAFLQEGMGGLWCLPFTPFFGAAPALAVPHSALQPLSTILKMRAEHPCDVSNEG